MSGGSGRKSEDEIIALYEQAEQFSKDGKLQEALTAYKLAFDDVKSGESGTDKSRQTLFSSKLARLCVKMEEFAQAKEYYDFMGEPLPSAVKVALGVDKLEAPAGVAAQKLMQFMQNSKRVETTAELHVGSKRIYITLYCQNKHNCWNYRAIGVEKRVRQGGVIYEPGTVPTQQNRADGLIEESFYGTLALMFTTIKSIAPDATLALGTVNSRRNEVADQALERIALAAWCEAFSVAVPIDKELKALQEAAQAETAKQPELAIQELRSGADGVTKWNRRRLEERKSFKILRAQNFSELDLSSVKFHENDLTETRFACANLKNCTMFECNLDKASFAKSHIDKATFQDCSAKQTDFAEASLEESRFLDTSLLAANFQKANLRKAEFKASYDTDENVLDRVNFQNANLQSATFNGVFLRGANFTGADCKGVTFKNCKYDKDTKFPSQFEPTSGLTLLPGALDIVPDQKSIGTTDDARVRSAIDKLTQFMQRMDLVDAFGPPETDTSIQEAEHLFSLSFPDDYKYFLRQLGGQRFKTASETTGYIEQFVPGFTLLGLRFAGGEYHQMNEVWDDIKAPIETKGPVKRMFKNARWWPIVDMGHDWLFLDMDPAHGGRHGQIISAADNSFDRAVVADSFSGLLERIIGLLEHCVNNQSNQSDQSDEADEADQSDELDESDESDIEDCLSDHLFDFVLSPLQTAVPGNPI